MSKITPKLPMRAALSAINRLLVNCQDEIIALNAPTQLISVAERRLQLQQQAGRRAVWGQALGEGVALLGEVPAKERSPAAKLASSLRYSKRMLTGAHDGHAYRATRSDAAEGALEETIPAVTLATH